MPTALITGASRGLGAQIARQLAPTHDLLLGGRPSPELDNLAIELDGASTFAVELTDYDEVAGAVEAINELDVLVHNAGVGSSLEHVADTPVEEWHHVLEINLVAVAELTRLLLPALRQAEGHVVFVNSGAGRNAKPRWAPYAASKFGLRALADSLRAEEPTLRVTSVYPGRIDTDMQRELVALEGRDYDASQFLRPESVAAAVVHAIQTPVDAHPQDIVLRPTGRG
ncbi:MULTISPECIES: SDR family oxidoreductase [Gordonia]|uniref:SDR family oxidoreductase n=1 Tax=Gordonia TaxID=2053 RepID=UPI0002A632BF|nr:MULTISPECIES: SDR family oxidoreductase [Gordonia]MBA5846953.1 SDR family oxidoreductase [Gordonia amicalis]MDV7099983.1 SDR family oxidoreductase [Gordonia amicalis]MDV7173128.1 SDR family oxidoreductase [Gordonia amicalis]NKX79620.1 SDR family oxidoreductase [Gordonia amicalis]UOG20148.1 SDR family oxidoreductase [Gordonia amicalis]